MQHQRIAIVGIHTGIGKTVTSAALTEALQADYWKPVQAGELDNSDTMKVASCVRNARSVIHPERYRLREPMSPHAAAAHEGIDIQLSDFVLPETDNLLLIETAGGVMSPLTQHHTMVDFVKHLNVPVILVSAAYLGSINHTLLCLEVLAQRNVEVLGVIFSGERNEESEDFVKRYKNMQHIAHVPHLHEVNAEHVQALVEPLRQCIASWVKAV